MFVILSRTNIFPLLCKNYWRYCLVLLHKHDLLSGLPKNVDLILTLITFFPQPPRPTFLAHLEFLKVCWIVHLVSNTNLNVPVTGGKKWCFCLPQCGRCVNSGCKELNKSSNNHAPTRLARSRVSVLATRPTANSRQSTSVMIPVLVVIVSSPSEPFSTFSTCSQTKLKPVNTMIQSLQSNQAETCQQCFSYPQSNQVETGQQCFSHCSQSKTCL